MYVSNKIILFALTTILFTNLLSMSSADTTTAQPGSVDDPIITKSYFDQNIKQKIADELGKQSMTEEKTRQIIAEEIAKIKPSSTSAPTSQPTTPQPVEGSMNLTIIRLEQGQSLYGGSGTEFIVRTGKAVVFSSDDNGIANVTNGKDITAGQAVELNNLLIVPREGRGIKPDPKNTQEIYVMVRGSYLLTNADGSKVSP
jgi:hypothetical protein